MNLDKIFNKEINRRDFLKGLMGGLGLAALAAGCKAINTPTPPPTSTNTPTPPPEIADLTFEPTKVVNDKVYDGLVRAVIEDPNRLISNVKLRFEPVSYFHLPAKAFPEEATREITLKPVDGEFDEPRKEFAAVIDNILGGREYQIEVNVIDKTGRRVAKSSIKTPYIREFENIADYDDVLVGAEYAAFWWGNYTYPYDPWLKPTTRKPQVAGKPLLGYYDSRDIFVFNKHIDWATGHGIDVFFIPWFVPSNAHVPMKYSYQLRIDSNFRENLLKNSKLLNSGEIEAAVLYDPYISIDELGRFEMDEKIGNHWGMDLNNPKNRETLLGDFRWISQYFSHPSYFKINGKPVVYIFNPEYFIGRSLDPRPAKRVFSQIKDELGVYLIGDFEITSTLPSQRNTPRLRACTELMKTFNGITDYGPLKPIPEQNTIEHWQTAYSEWSKFARDNGLALVPTTTPGFDITNRVAPEPPWLVVPRSPEDFYERTEVGLNYINPKIRMLFLTSFNDWFEGTMIEPGRELKGMEPGEEYGLLYLNILKKALRDRGS